MNRPVRGLRCSAAILPNKETEIPPDTGTALIILVAFVLPGFVTIRFNELTHHIPERSATAFERLLQALYYSTWVYSLLALVALCLSPSDWPVPFTRAEGLAFLHGRQPFWLYVALLAVGLLVAPAIVSSAGRLWSEKVPWRDRVLAALGINPNHRVPTAWDRVFLRQEAFFVRAILTDGRVVGGTYTQAGFAAYANTGGDLYLEQQWTLDEEDWWFQEPALGTEGLWIPRVSIISIELYAVPHEQTDANDLEAGSDGSQGRTHSTRFRADADQPASSPEAE